MYCPKCGSELIPGAAFCGKCGTACPQVSPDVPKTETEQTKPPVQPDIPVDETDISLEQANVIEASVPPQIQETDLTEEPQVPVTEAYVNVDNSAAEKSTPSPEKNACNTVSYSKPPSKKTRGIVISCILGGCLLLLCIAVGALSSIRKSNEESLFANYIDLLKDECDSTIIALYDAVLSVPYDQGGYMIETNYNNFSLLETDENNVFAVTGELGITDLSYGSGRPQYTAEITGTLTTNYLRNSYDWNLTYNYEYPLSAYRNDSINPEDFVGEFVDIDDIDNDSDVEEILWIDLRDSVLTVSLSTAFASTHSLIRITYNAEQNVGQMSGNVVSFQNVDVHPVYYEPGENYDFSLTYIPASDAPRQKDTICMTFVSGGSSMFVRVDDSYYYESDSQTSSVYTYNGDDAYIYPSNTEYITEWELDSYTRDEIVLIRNEIYARHGYNFSDANIRAYFESQSWYRPVAGLNASTFDTSVFNDYERTNLDTIINYEQEMGWR